MHRSFDQSSSASARNDRRLSSRIRTACAFWKRRPAISLGSPSATLSGGEGQRIRLATQIGSQLRGVLYVLDEPSIGLHPRDNQRLLETLCALRDLGNTVLVVEHDEETIRRADYVVDLGPGAGAHGGRVVAAGTPDQVSCNPESITGLYICGAREIACLETPPRHAITAGARANI